MNLKYLLGVIISLPFLPLMYLQGKRIKTQVPSLPEANGPEGTVEKASPSKPFRLLAIGESTIAGVGVETHAEGFAGTLANEIATKLAVGVKWNVYAKSGYTAQKIHQIIVPEIKEQSFDLIIVGLGGNDAFNLNKPRNWKSQIQQLIEALRLKFDDTPIVFTNMPPIKEFPAFTPLIKFTIGNLVEIFGEELAKIVREQEGVYFYSRIISVDSWVERLNIKAPPDAFFSDGVHPSKFTYQIWAKDFCNFIFSKKALRDQFDKEFCFTNT